MPLDGVQKRMVRFPVGRRVRDHVISGHGGLVSSGAAWQHSSSLPASEMQTDELH